MSHGWVAQLVEYHLVQQKLWDRFPVKEHTEVVGSIPG